MRRVTGGTWTRDGRRGGWMIRTSAGGACRRGTRYRCEVASKSGRTATVTAECLWSSGCEALLKPVGP